MPMNLHTTCAPVNREWTCVYTNRICKAHLDPHTGEIFAAALDPLETLLSSTITGECIDEFMNSEGDSWNGECWTSDDADDFWIELTDEDGLFTPDSNEPPTLIPEDYVPTEEERDRRYEATGEIWTVNGWEKESDVLDDILTDVVEDPFQIKGIIEKLEAGTPLLPSDVFGGLLGPRPKLTQQIRVAPEN